MLHASSSPTGLCQRIILGLLIPGVGLTVALLAVYAWAACSPISRRHLDRVSFRLLVYAMLSHVVFGIVYCVGTLNVYGSSWNCGLVAFLINLSLMFSAGMFFCMALNLPLVLAHKVNGRKMEKYYVLVTTVVCLACNVTPYASGHLGYDLVSGTCWYRSSDPAALLWWVMGTQSVWILFVSAGEVIAFLTIVGYLFVYELETLRLCSSANTSLASHTSHTTGSTIRLFRNIILRIGLYPLVSCLLNVSTAVLDLHELIDPDHTGKSNLVDLSIYAARPLIYGLLAATDPAFLRALHALRHPKVIQSACASRTAQWITAPCLSTVLETVPDFSGEAVIDAVGHGKNDAPKTDDGALDLGALERTQSMTECSADSSKRADSCLEPSNIGVQIVNDSRLLFDVVSHL
ncbi:hypothetical protein C8R43DRAFT_284299 [Mycena crocata]|nr:hypothetical protein C8R43DRAFT_284299 [Mycena crocata]